MLSRADRILSELLLSRGIVARETLERCVRERESGARDQSLAETIAEEASVDPQEVARLEEEARSLDRALTPSLPGGGRLGEFRILREIGRGGMGIVYEAHQEALDRRVALKILPAGAALDEKLSIRFLREARAAARLDHPGIVRVLSSGIAEGVLFFTMDLVQGPSLADSIKEGPLDPDRAATIASQVARGLAHAHAAGLVHRDIKPENILIGGDGSARITDFGLVHEASALPVTVSHLALGTPAYMAPEQAIGNPVDGRSDVYSLGAVLYAMLTGRPPHSGEVPAVVIARVLNDPIAPIEGVREDVPRGLAATCERALAKEPGDRYPSAEAMAEDLERFLRGERTEASGRARSQGETLPGGIVGAGRRRRRTLLEASMVVILVAAGLGAALLLRSRQSAPAPSTSTPPVVEGVFTRIPGTPGRKQRLSVFPDGRRLLWASDADGDMDLYVHEIDTGRLVNLTPDDPDEDFSPALSLEGGTIAFGSLRTPDQIFLLPSAGGAPRSLSISTRGAPCAWSPDGRFLALSGKGSPTSGGPVGYYGLISIVSTESGQSRLLMGRDAADPSWSPDGRWLAVLSSTGGHSDVWTVPSQGSGPRRATDDPAEEWSPRFSPDGRYLYFASDRGGSIALWRVGFDPASGTATGSPVQITRAAFAAPFDISIAKDSRTIYLLPYWSQRTIHSITIDPFSGRASGSPHWLARDLRQAGSADISPDGSRLVVSLRIMGTSHENLVTVRPDGSGRFIVTDGDFRDLSPRWSPDATRIAFQSDRGGRMEIWTIRPDGSDLVRVASAPSSDAFSPVWSPDGSRLIFGAADGAHMVPVREGRPAGNPQPVMTSGGTISHFEPSSWSSGGDVIAGTAGGIVICPLSDQSCRRLVPSGRNPVWLPDGRRLLYIQGSSIRVLDVSSGEHHEVLSAAPNGLGTSLSLASDGRSACLSLTSSDEAIWKLVLRDEKPIDQGVR